MKIRRFSLWLALALTSVGALVSCHTRRPSPSPTVIAPPVAAPVPVPAVIPSLRERLGGESFVRMGVQGDLIHMADLVTPNVLVALSHSRLMLLSTKNINNVIAEIHIAHRSPRPLVLHRGHVYLSRKECIDIYDVSDGQHIRHVGEIPITQTEYRVISVANDRLYIPDSQARVVRVFDVHHPSKLHEVFSIKMPDNLTPNNVCPVGNRVFVLCYKQLLIYDVSDEQAPALLGRTEIASRLTPGAMYVRDTLVYIFAGHEIHIFDVSKPNTIERVAVHPRETYQSFGLNRDGGVLFFGRNGKTAYRLDDPLKPEKLNSMPGQPRQSMIIGSEHDWIIAEDGSAAPAEIFPTLLPRPGYMLRDGWRLCMVDGLLCIVGPLHAVTLDLTDPEKPAVVGVGPGTRLTTRKQVVARGTLLLTAAAIIDIADPSQPKLRGRIGAGNGIAVRGDTVWITNKTALETWNIADPDKPQRVATQSFNEPLSCLVAHGDILYAAQHVGGVFALSIEPDGTFTELGKLELPFTKRSFVLDMQREGDRLYATVNDAGVIAIDISNPKDMKLFSSFNTSQSSETLDVRQGIAAVADGSGGTLVVDLRIAGVGKVLASDPTADWTRDVLLVGDYLYSLDSDGGLVVQVADKFLTPDTTSE